MIHMHAHIIKYTHEADATSVLLNEFSVRFLLERVLACMNVQILFDDVCVCMYVCM